MTDPVTGSHDRYATTAPASPELSADTLAGITALTHLLWERRRLSFDQVEAVTAAELAALYESRVAPALAEVEEQVRRRVDHPEGGARYETATVTGTDPDRDPPPTVHPAPPATAPAR